MRVFRRGFAACAVLALAWGALAACASEELRTYEPPAQSTDALPAPLRAQLDEALAHAVEVSAASGAIAGVWVPEVGMWVAGTGTQSSGTAEPVRPEQSFRIAQLTRLMTCDVLHRVAEEGTVSLTDSVAEWVSGVGSLSAATLGQLCDGTSGLGSSAEQLTKIWNDNPERVWTPLELAGHGISRFDAAARGSYRDSDAGYVLLGLALERATGKTASELIAHYVTGPLGLTDTVLPGAAPAEPGADPLRGHLVDTEDGARVCEAARDVTRASASAGFTDAGVVSTITDLGRYLRAAASAALFSDENAPRFGAPVAASPTDPTWRRAIGGAQYAGPFVGQFGSVPGYSVAGFSDPASGLTVAVVLNDSTDGGTLALYLALELAALAAQAPMGDGTPLALPFTAATYHEALDALPPCVAASAPEEEEAE